MCMELTLKEENPFHFRPKLSKNMQFGAYEMLLACKVYQWDL